MGRKEDLNDALRMQHEIVMQGSDDKVEIEKYKILHEMVLAENKYIEEGEFKESEMVLKEQAAELDAKLKAEESKRKKAESILKGMQVTGEIGTGIVGMILYQKNFKSLLANESTIHVIPQRPFMFLKSLESVAIKGLGRLVRW